jgi:hypothetical protein
MRARMLDGRVSGTLEKGVCVIYPTHSLTIPPFALE